MKKILSVLLAFLTVIPVNSINIFAEKTFSALSIIGKTTYKHHIPKILTEKPVNHKKAFNIKICPCTIVHSVSGYV